MPQPTWPAPEPMTDVELDFIDLSPPELWPDNQDSNFGQLRKVISDQLQTIGPDQLQIILNNVFIESASAYLDLWEQQVGLPANPTGKTLEERRASILARWRSGPFTRARRRLLVETYIIATFGTALSLTPDGLGLTSAGLSLLADTTSVTNLYRIYEQISDFTYLVRIANTSTPDIPILTRELLAITPAGIQFTIDNTRAPSALETDLPPGSTPG